MRHLIIVFHTLLFGCGLQLSASEKNNDAPAPQLSDREVVALLSTSEVLQWEAAQEQLKAGKSQVDSGNRLINRPPSALRRPEEVAQDRADGKQMVTRGEQAIAAAQARLDRLRQIAIAKAQAAPDIKEEDTTINLELSPSPLSDAIPTLTETLLFDIWGQGYGRIYLDGVYAINTGDELPFFIMDSAITENLRQVISRLDGTRFTFVADPDLKFTLGLRAGHAVIDFPGRDQVMRHYKSVLVYGELAYDPGQALALFSIRAIDLSSMRIVASELTSVYVDNELRNAFLNSEEPSADDAPDQIEAKALHVRLVEKNSFLQRLALSNTPFLFSINYIGDTSGIDCLSASMISKSILLDAKVPLLDTDFVKTVMTRTEASADTEINDRTNAIWKLTPLSSSRSGKAAFDVEAVSLLRDTPSSVPVGLMEVHRIAVDVPQPPATTTTKDTAQPDAIDGPTQSGGESG